SEVAETGNPNPFREDARITAASIFVARGRKIDALKQYEALASEAQKPSLKAESAVRGGMIALDLVQADKGKVDKAMADRAEALLRKGRALPEAGKFRAIAQAGLRRLQYQIGQYAQLLAEYKKDQENLPEAAQAEVLLLAANSERQLGHSKEAETLYGQIIKKYPDREEAKDAAYQRLINVYNSDPSALISAVDEFLATSPTNEREAALQLKALILGQEENTKGMMETFRQLLREFPKSSVAAQAQYYIGKAAFESKDYKTALTALNTARQLNKDQYYNLASLRIMLCQFYLKDRNALTKEANSFMANSPNTNVRQ